MNRKGWSLRYYAGGGGAFSPMCTSDSMDSCMAPGFWQTLIYIAEVRKKVLFGNKIVQIEAHRPENPVVLPRGNPAQPMK